MYHACHSRILGFLLLLVSYIGLQKNLSTVGYEMTVRFSYIVCVIVLSWFKIKLLLKTKNCRKQISYGRYFAYPFEISHREKTRFFKHFSLVFFTLFHKNNRTCTLTNLRKILKNLLSCMIFLSGKSPNLLFLLLGKYQSVCGPFFNLECKRRAGKFPTLQTCNAKFTFVWIYNCTQ